MHLSRRSTDSISSLEFSSPCGQILYQRLSIDFLPESYKQVNEAAIAPILEGRWLRINKVTSILQGRQTVDQ